jgi:hypothetical protein
MWRYCNSVLMPTYRPYKYVIMQNFIRLAQMVQKLCRKNSVIKSNAISHYTNGLKSISVLL